MSFHFPFDIIFRSVIVYVFILIAIRIFGKKELSQLSIIDLVLILLISNSVQNAMVGSDSSLQGGLIAASALFITNYLLKILLYRYRKFGRFLQGEPVLLIHSGKLLEDNMKKERITMRELEEAAREHGVDISDVDLAVLETDGNISILSDSYSKHTKRKRRVQKTMTKM